MKDIIERMINGSFFLKRLKTKTLIKKQIITLWSQYLLITMLLEAPKNKLK